MLIALVGFGIGVNAQTCPIPGTYDSISIISVKKGSYTTSSHNDCGCTGTPNYILEIKNPSSKTVSFKITAVGAKNINQAVVYCTVNGKASVNVCFAAISKDYHIDDYKIEVTSCSN